MGDCVDELCALEIGRLLSADQIVFGTVAKLSDLYYLTVKIIDVHTGRNLITKKEQDESLAALVGKLDSVALLLAGEDSADPEYNKIVRLVLPSGRYEGPVKDGNPHGRGTYYHTNGDRYEGEFRDGKYNGQGTCYFANGDVYAGKWADNQPIGGWLHGSNRARKWVTAWWD